MKYFFLTVLTFLPSLFADEPPHVKLNGDLVCDETRFSNYLVISSRGGLPISSLSPISLEVEVTDSGGNIISQNHKEFPVAYRWRGHYPKIKEPKLIVGKPNERILVEVRQVTWNNQKYDLFHLVKLLIKRNLNYKFSTTVPYVYYRNNKIASLTVIRDLNSDIFKP